MMKKIKPKKSKSKKFRFKRLFKIVVYTMTVLLAIAITWGRGIYPAGETGEIPPIMKVPTEAELEAEQELERLNNRADTRSRDTQIPREYFPFPELYAPILAEQIVNPENTVYLTFDDGPSENTITILDTLKEKGVRATFFVMGIQVEKHPEIIERIVEEGHAIGIHTDTHDYNTIYTSVEAFLKDYDDCYQKIRAITDYPVTVTRFPGGSNVSFNRRIRMEIIRELENRGFAYYDWNVSTADSAPRPPSTEKIIRTVKRNSEGFDKLILLGHDSEEKAATAQAVGPIIDHYRSKGFNFGVLTNEIAPIQFTSSS